ncbi:MAG: ATP-binding cassette domain-containing protein [Eubacteriales bacterium]
MSRRLREWQLGQLFRVRIGGIDLSTLLEMKGICKSFNGVPALRDVQLTLESGEVHALLGENGAGKSTLIKILGGIYSKDSGEVYIDGKQVEITNVKEARANGISIIHQELMMLPQMSIYENVFLGQEYKNNGFVKRNEMIQKTQEMLEFFSLIWIRGRSWVVCRLHSSRLLRLSGQFPLERVLLLWTSRPHPFRIRRLNSSLTQFAV